MGVQEVQQGTEHKVLMRTSIEGQGVNGLINSNQQRSAGQEVQNPVADGDLIAQAKLQQFSDELYSGYGCFKAELLSISSILNVIVKLIQSSIKCKR